MGENFTARIFKFFEPSIFFEFLKDNAIKILLGIVIYKLGVFGSKYIDKFFKLLFEKAKIDKSVSSFIRSLLRIVYYVVIILIILSLFEVNVSTITGFIGALSLILGFAFKETLNNFFGGFIILTFKPFKVGDVIEYKNYQGEVVSIEIFYTKIRNYQNELVIIPNGILTNTELRNLSKNKVRRLDLKITVDYKADIRKVKEILQEIVNNNPLALKRPEYIIGLGELGSIGIIYSVFVYVKVEDYANLKYSLNEEIKLKFEANGIHIPNTILDTYRIKEGE
jgi:small conductance mechanosensitive channel